MDESLTRDILDVIYRDSQVRRAYKDVLSDWILDARAKNAPVTAAALIDYLAAHQPDLLDRLKVNVRLQGDLAEVLHQTTRN